MKTFEEYVLNWWREYLRDHDFEYSDLMQAILGENEKISDYLGEEEDCYHWLYQYDDAEKIYKTLFGYDAKILFLEDLPHTQDFLQGMYEQANQCDFNFAKELIEDMAEHSINYNCPDEFFGDLLRGGCQSGMIGMFIYNNDCKNFYVKNIDEMEEFVEDFEDEIGEPIRNDKHLPHYVFLCWLCYEEIAYRIANVLFPEKF